MVMAWRATKENKGTRIYLGPLSMLGFMSFIAVGFWLVSGLEVGQGGTTGALLGIGRTDLTWGLRGHNSAPEPREMEAVYHEWFVKARATAKTVNDGTRNIWDLFEGIWRCGIEDRIGKIGDGGKWVCNPQDLDHGRLGRRCVVYSFGSAGEVSFEQEVMDRYQCEVHTFDPTLDRAVKVRMRSIPGLHFHPVGIEAHRGGTGSVSTAGERGMQHRGYRSLRQIMATLEHKWVDVLKIDIEGNEWDLFNNDLLCSRSLPASQVEFWPANQVRGEDLEFALPFLAHPLLSRLISPLVSGLGGAALPRRR